MDIQWTNEKRRLGDLIPRPDNPRQILEADAERLERSLAEFGQVQTIAIEADGTLVDGHQRAQVWAAAQKFGDDYEVDVRVASRKLSDQERQALVIALHGGASGSWDWDALALFDFDTVSEWGFDNDLLERWNGDAANLCEMLKAKKTTTDDDSDGGEDQPARAFYVPDAIFPSDNEWDVPTLDIALQADFLELPLTKWGDKSRKGVMRGTYHFYTEDYKFDALWKKPLGLINSQCVAIVEPNFSTNEQMPQAVGLWSIYRKRWLARYAQSYGVKVWADLTVAPKFAELNLLGVPNGWGSYCTRALDKQVELIIADYEIAREHAGQEPHFLVYGGGKQSQALCKERGWQWLPENMDVKNKRKEADYG